jgi:hypothetical protein
MTSRTHLSLTCITRSSVCSAASLSCDLRGSRLPEALAGFLVILLHSWVTNSSHCCYHEDDPLIQSP